MHAPRHFSGPSKALSTEPAIAACTENAQWLLLACLAFSILFPRSSTVDTAAPVESARRGLGRAGGRRGSQQREQEVPTVPRVEERR